MDRQERYSKERIMRFVSRMILGLLAAAVTGLAGGCSSPGQYRLDVTMDSSLNDAAGRMRSVEVDLVGVNSSQLAQYTSYSMTKFWTEGDALRENAVKKVLAFGPDLPTWQRFEIDDPIWGKWKQDHDQYLFVMVFLPGIFTDAEGERDARRAILPLAKNRWDGKSISIQVQSSGIKVVPPPKPQ
jgi:hypothetical protein